MHKSAKGVETKLCDRCKRLIGYLRIVPKPMTDYLGTTQRPIG